MANATEPPLREFPGDEFANNLFSDLAPLLTLFGEQVTKQFLSMSMGWEDNVLLAMGPLGILTIIVSAIRVGGVRQLKALVGRGRESVSTAEQELLSSTSDDVCELWNGNEIVRTIGSPAGMKNLVVARDLSGRLNVYDILTAYQDDVIRARSAGGKNRRSHVPNPERLRDAAPNLALNVKNATVSKWELRLWAALGVALQFAAMAVPGVTTYYWKWEKAGIQIAPYGYPCFLIGTALVVIGVMICGHVIEDITDESCFYPRYGVVLIVRLQRSCTVGDQHFSAFAIRNSPDDLVLRTSSRTLYRDHSALAAAGTAFSVVGFVVQFIGLRALHWSATIMQLGATLLMTGVRAFVRRGLATNPICDKMLDGHETASFTMRLLQDDNLKDGRSVAAGHAIERSPGFVPTWEVPTLIDDKLRTTGVEYTRKQGEKENLFDDLQLDSPLKVEKPPLDEWEHTGAAELHAAVQALMPRRDQVTDMADVLAAAIERLVIKFAHNTTLVWGRNSAGKNPFSEPEYTWYVPAMTQTHRERLKTATAAKFLIDLEEPRGLSEGDRGHLHGVLALWLYALEERTKTLRHAKNSTLRSWEPRISTEVQGAHLRIVAQVEEERESTALAYTLMQWLGQPIRTYVSNRGGLQVTEFSGEEHYGPIFGAYLSTLSSQASFQGKGWDLCLETRRESGLVLLCAQELLSLFILGVASEVSHVGGKTSYKRNKEVIQVLSTREWNNSTFQELAQEVVDSGMAHDLTEAYTLVIPAFHHYGLLPTEETDAETRSRLGAERTEPGSSSRTPLTRSGRDMILLRSGPKKPEVAVGGNDEGRDEFRDHDTDERYLRRMKRKLERRGGATTDEDGATATS